MKRSIFIAAKILVTIITLIAAANIWIVLQTTSHIYAGIDEIPKSKLALVLGTSKYMVGGGINPYFQNRINAAVQLYMAGKVKHILVSGDHQTAYYNEPKTMKEELVRMGIPEEDITLDHAGLRTLDSIVRCKEVFGQEEFVIVTQKFHSYRAIFISQYYGLETSGYIAKGMPMINSPLLMLRELLARPLAIIDLFVLQTSPKFLGEREDLNI